MTENRLRFPATEISPMFPPFYHHDKNQRRNAKKCMGISVTVLVLITKFLRIAYVSLGRAVGGGRAAAHGDGRSHPPLAAAARAGRCHHEFMMS
eukprot:COSAG01_NODE_23_length_37704_cov_30.005877_16_plen_94_part_00